MDGHGEHSQHPEGTAQRGRQDGWLAFALQMGTLIAVSDLAIQPFFSLVSLQAAPQAQLAYGGATYAVAIVASLLRGWVSKLPVELLRLVADSVVISLLFFPPLMGSMCIVLAVNQLAGWGIDGRGAIFIGVFLYGVFALPLVVVIAIVRRTAMHG